MNNFTTEHFQAIKEFSSPYAPSPASIRRLQNEFGEEAAAHIATSAKLQSKAREKLGEDIWLATEKSLQQATPWQVARAKSAWLSDRPVYDLCCGLGGDSLQLARRGPVVGVDLDPSITRIAAANLRSCKQAACVCADAVTYRRDPETAIHIDPDRRSEQRRSTRPDLYQPDWNSVVAMVRDSSAALIKLAPAADIDTTELPNCHRVWISLRGSVREQTLLCGDSRSAYASTAGKDRLVTQRSALVVRRDESQHHYIPEIDAERTAVSSETPTEVMVDPDAAIRAAGLTDAFARQHELTTLGGPAGFLSGKDFAVSQALAIAEPVVWVGSTDNRNLRRELRRRDLFPKRIKVRGVDIDPAKLQKKLRDCGSIPATLWMGRTQKGRYAVLTTNRETSPDN